MRTRLLLATIVTILCAVAIACGGEGEKARDLGAAKTTPVPQATSTPQSSVNSPTATTAIPTSTPSPTSVPAKVAIVESGFVSYTNSLGKLNTPWAVILKDPSESQQAIDTKVTVIFYDASGVVVETNTDIIPVIFPGGVVAATSFVTQPEGTPARMEVRTTGTKFQKGTTQLSLQVTDVQFITDRFFPKITGKIKNPFDTDLTQLRLVCIAKDTDSRYVAVGTSFLELVPAGTTAVGSCSIDSRLDTASATSFALYANVSSLTLLEITPAAGQ